MTGALWQGEPFNILLLHLGLGSLSVTWARLEATSQPNRLTHPNWSSRSKPAPPWRSVDTGCRARANILHRRNATGMLESALRFVLKPLEPRKGWSPPLLPELPEPSNETVPIDRSSRFVAVWGKQATGKLVPTSTPDM